MVLVSRVVVVVRLVRMVSVVVLVNLVVLSILSVSRVPRSLRLRVPSSWVMIWFAPVPRNVAQGAPVRLARF